jgi:mono/diheme cytochrome c family protein
LRNIGKVFAIALTITSAFAINPVYSQTVTSEVFSQGNYDFLISCASCHGRDGKGNGPFARTLQKTPTDLTKLASFNGGVFPFKRVVASIDGRKNFSSHMIREMPIWGWRFREEAERNYIFLPAEIQVKNRVKALALYISSLQKN